MIMLVFIKVVVFSVTFFGVYSHYAEVSAPWKIPHHEAKSFLTNPTRFKRSDPRCNTDEYYCETHKASCRQFNEQSREHYCGLGHSCTATQTCYLSTPCPAHYVLGCSTDLCLSLPCFNGGTCAVTGSTHSCTCVPGWDSATDCNTEVDECSSNPCVNGGTCTDQLNRYTCTCESGFTGNNCETDINECASNPCTNGATCVDNINGYHCSCVPGYTGSNCQTDTNECSSNPCQNGATCNDLINKYSCTCLPGYTGTNCETDINECSSDPCQNGASCNDLVNEYSCSCVPGYSGIDCQTDINECQSIPCLHAGSCNNLIDAYSCDCTGRYEGGVCDIDCRPGPVDLVFVVDTSSSLEKNINRSIDYMVQFVSKIPIGPDDFQLGVVTYSFVPEVLFDLDDYSTNSEIIQVLKTITGKNGPTLTSSVIHKAHEMLTNISMGSRANAVNKYIVLLYDGLSSDGPEAIQTAVYFNSHGIRIYTIAIGDSISHQEMLGISQRPMYTFSPLKPDDMFYLMVKETERTDCNDCLLETTAEVILLVDTTYNQTHNDYYKRLIALRQTIEKLVTYGIDVHIGVFSYSDDIDQVIPLTSSFSIVQIIGSALQIDRDSTFSTSNTSHALHHIRTESMFTSSRRLVVFYSNGIWSDHEDVKAEISALSNIQVDVLSVIAGDDSSSTNFKYVLKDPSYMFYVNDDDFTALESLAAMTKRYTCDSDIYNNRQ